MPQYTFKCSSCGTVQDVTRKMSELSDPLRCDKFVADSAASVDSNPDPAKIRVCGGEMVNEMALTASMGHQWSQR